MLRLATTSFLAILSFYLVQLLCSDHILASPLPFVQQTQDDLWAKLRRRYDDTHITNKDPGLPGNDLAESPYPDDAAIKQALQYRGTGNPQLGAVFWTAVTNRRGETLTRQFAEENNFVWIQSVLPAHYICTRYEDWSAWFGNFVDRSSGLFADWVDRRATIYLVTSSVDRLSDIDLERTWARMEAPSLWRRGWEEVTVVDADNFNNRKVWKISDMLRWDYLLRQESELIAVNGSDTSPQFERRFFNPFFRRFDWDGDGDDPGSSCPALTTSPYTPGWCGVHINQYAPKLLSKDQPNWVVAVHLKDAKQRDLLPLNYTASVETDHVLSIDSPLPSPFQIIPAHTRNDPLKLKYSDWSTMTLNNRGYGCSVGGWDHGFVRQMDCGFPCPPQR